VVASALDAAVHDAYGKLLGRTVTTYTARSSWDMI
jgi:L-alanine-DL-glutamate epimerase-like enolase superfamily enzyme